MSGQSRYWRNIRVAAYACVALAIVEVLVLPWPFGTAAKSSGLLQWTGQIAFSLAFALALFLRQRWAALLLGVYGVSRLYLIGAGVVHILDGSALVSGMGPAAFVMLCIPLPFALCGYAPGGAQYSFGGNHKASMPKPSNGRCSGQGHCGTAPSAPDYETPLQLSWGVRQQSRSQF